VPRRMAWLGLVGGPLLIVFGTAVMFGGNHPSSTLNALKGIATIPEILWELFLGVYCTIWGFRRDAPILSPSAS
jgi:peptidoglycan/LPS O-acetylase OafA/YrhL